MPLLTRRTMDLGPVEAFGDAGNATVDLSVIFSSPANAAFEFVELQGSGGILAGGAVNTAAGQRGYLVRFFNGTSTGMASAPEGTFPYQVVVHPWADVLRITCTDEHLDDLQFMLFDARGALLSHQVATGAIAKAGIELPLNDLANGLHLMIVQKSF